MPAPPLIIAAQSLARALQAHTVAFDQNVYAAFHLCWPTLGINLHTVRARLPPLLPTQGLARAVQAHSVAFY